LLRYRIITSGVIILLFAAVGSLNPGIAWMNSRYGQMNQSSLIRLHVIANSDSAVDQSLKLKVRDQIIKATEPLLLHVQDPQTAEALIVKSIPKLKQVAYAELVKQGRAMPVQVVYGRFQFPERQYPFGILPAGEYKGIRVILGEGKGRNWWCVLYPPLCLLAPDAPGFRSGVALPTRTPKIEYHLAILEEWVKAKGLAMDQFWRGWGKFFGLL